jgi:hypothetical protein
VNEGIPLDGAGEKDPRDTELLASAMHSAWCATHPAPSVPWWALEEPEITDWRVAALYLTGLFEAASLTVMNARKEYGIEGLRKVFPSLAETMRGRSGEFSRGWSPEEAYAIVCAFLDHMAVRLAHAK